jgi:RHS repeat-associated protein
VVETTKRFVYDGWNVVEEQTVAQASRYYVWGLDLSQSLQGAGGIGGLIVRVESATTHNFLHDGNGNVGQLINAATGALDAHYEYDPYGNTIVATGILAATNPYRFSAKYLDVEFNLYYYGYRYYDPQTGRWLSRDPQEEEGGLNLYAFLSNNGINFVDYLGWYKILSQVVQSVGGSPKILKDNSGYLNQPPLSYLPDDHQAVRYGWAWLLGIAPETTYFNQNSQMVQDILDHEGIKKARDVIKKELRNKTQLAEDFDISRKVPNYSLGGFQGILKYLRDYSVVFTGERFGGNLTITFLGSYQIRPVIVSNIDQGKCTADVYIEIHNPTGLESGTRFPVFGYLDEVFGVPTATIQDIFSGRFGVPNGILNDNAFGPIGRNTEQILHWGEEIYFGDE